MRGNRLGWSPTAPTVEKRIREALATPGRPGVRVIAKHFGVNPARCSGSAALSSRTRSRREAGQTVAGPRFRRIQVCPKDLPILIWQVGIGS
jgi:hypothetical protein